MASLKLSLAVFLILGIAFTVSSPVFDRFRRTPKETVVGAPAHINLDDPDVKEAARFAVSSISSSSGSDLELGLFKIVSATRQVVAGSLYTIKLQAAGAKCTTTATPPPPACADDPDFGEYTVKVWDQPWKSPRFQITSVEPTNKISKKKSKGKE